MGYQETRRDFLKALPRRSAALVLLASSACSKPPEPLPVPKEFDQRNFALGRADFSIKDNISLSDAKRIRSLYERAYPLLVNLFGVDIDECTSGQRKVHISLMAPEAVKAVKLAKMKGTTKTYQDRVEVNLFDPKDQLVALHEFTHLFIMPALNEFDLTQEGYVVVSEIIIGQQLGLIKSVDGVTLKRLGGFYEPGPFLNQDLATVSYDAYPPLAELRYLAAGLAWLSLYQEDPQSFKQLSQFYAEEICHGFLVDDFYRKMSQLYPRNFEALLKANPILKPPELGQHLSFTLMGQGEDFAVCLYEFRQQAGGIYVDVPIQGESLVCEIEYRGDNGGIVYQSAEEIITDASGICALVHLPKGLGFETNMVPPGYRTSRLVISVRSKNGLEKQIKQNVLPMEIQKKPTGYLHKISPRAA